MKQLKKWLVPLLLLAGAGGVLAQDIVPEALAPAKPAARPRHRRFRRNLPAPS